MNHVHRHDDRHHHDHDDHAAVQDHHGHHHGIHQHQLPANHGTAFALAIGLNTVFVIVEFIFGIVANSTALTADAGHNLSDVLGLILAWVAAALSRRMPGGRYTYGLRSSSILAAVANAALLLVACGAIGWETVHRLWHPPAVEGSTVMLVAGVGIVVNGFSAWLFVKQSSGDLNIRGAYLHMAADAAVSLGVVLAGLVMMYTGWLWLDPVVSLVIVVVIVIGTWGLLRESLDLAMHAIPARIDVKAIESYLRSLAGVTDIHDLHVWGMSTTESALTVHLVTPAGYPGDAFMDEVESVLRTKHAIHHSTVQVEMGTTAHACRLSSLD